jgi:hypothetical protein
MNIATANTATSKSDASYDSKIRHLRYGYIDATASTTQGGWRHYPELRATE